MVEGRYPSVKTRSGTLFLSVQAGHFLIQNDFLIDSMQELGELIVP